MQQGYEGGELELFSHATTWKAYWSEFLRPFVHGHTLEVGAGIGSNTALLRRSAERWTCLEPDPGFCERLRRLTPTVDVICGTSHDLPESGYDAIVYLDTLEHIEDDAAELARTATLLRPRGHLIVLAPAHQRLYSAFDAKVGHFRRYNLRGLRAIAPPGVAEARTAYLDSAGLLASVGNRALLRQGLPTRTQIGIWDRALVPASRWLDRGLGYRLGKSAVIIWQRP